VSGSGGAKQWNLILYMKRVKQRTAEPQNIEYRMSKGGIASLNHFLIKLTEYINSTFDIQNSIFDIRFFSVSFSIYLTTFLASVGADT
jgi:hypothetical protein